MPSRLLSVLVVALWASPALFAATYYVSADGRDAAGRDGSSPSQAWASLAYACSRIPAGDNTLNVGAGVFVATTTARPASGLTIEGAGSSGPGATVIRTAADWTVSGDPMPSNNFEYTPTDYLISAWSYDPVGPGTRIAPLTIRAMRFESVGDNLAYGAIFLRDVNDATLEDLVIDNFGWAGINLAFCKRATVHDCDFSNAARVYDRESSGSLRSISLEDSEIVGCTFNTTVSSPRPDGNSFLPVDYKGFFHNGVRLHDCDFRGGKTNYFDIECPGAEEYGLEIYDCSFDGIVSVPRVGDQPRPQTRGFDYTVWLHDNYFTNSYAIEGPRTHLRISSNFFDVERNGGRIYSQFGGGSTAGPVWIHDNVAEDVDFAFVYKESGQLDSMFLYNNTVYYRNSDDDPGNARSLLATSGPLTGWRIENNIFVADPADPRAIGASVGCGSCPADEVPVVRGNLFVNVEGDIPAGNFADADPGLALSGPKPSPYYRPASAESFVVDRGVALPYARDRAFAGARPDVGAYEYDGPAAPTSEEPTPTAGAPDPDTWYVLKNKDSGLNMRTADCDSDPENPVELFKGDGTCAQWRFVETADRYLIENRISGLNLRHDGEAPVSNETTAELWTGTGGRTAFVVAPSPEPGYVHLRHKGSGLNLRNADCADVNDETLVEFFDGTGDCARWELIPVAEVNARAPAADAVERLSLRVAPNPAEDLLTVTLADAAATARITLTDATGRVVFGDVVAGEATLSVRDLPRGMYFARVEYDGAAAQTRKVLLE